MFPGSPVTKLHFALSSTSGTGHTQHPTVRSFLAAKSACASVCPRTCLSDSICSCWLTNYAATTSDSEQSIHFHPGTPTHIILSKQQSVKCQFGACLHVYALLPESTKGAKLSLQSNFGPKNIFFYARKSLKNRLFQAFPTR